MASKMATLLAVNSGKGTRGTREAVGQGDAGFFRERPGPRGSSQSRPPRGHGVCSSLALGLESHPSPV